MKMLGLIFLFSQLLHAEPIKQANLWSECIESYQRQNSVFFDVAYNENDPKKKFMFRNGKHHSPEALNIFNGGQFWTTEIKIENGFYEKKNVLVIMGAEKFCLKQEFNWVRADTMTLVPYNEKTCRNTTTYTMNPTQSEAKPSAEDVLLLKMQTDINITLSCLTDKREGGCQEKEKQTEFQRLTKWKTQACERIDNFKLKELIAEKKRVLSEYFSAMKIENLPTVSKKETKKSEQKTKN